MQPKVNNALSKKGKKKPLTKYTSIFRLFMKNKSFILTFDNSHL